MEATSRYFNTSDGTRLCYLDAGKGEPLVFLPGWSQTAAMWNAQLVDLARDYRCLALDWRGHGESAKVGHGYRHGRLAMDVREWLVALGVEGATFIGHSMGCRVISFYWELFGAERMRRLVWTDQTPLAIIDPAWDEDTREQYGARITFEGLQDLLARLAGPDGASFTREFLAGMFTSAFSAERLDWVYTENMKFPREHAAFLLRETLLGDVRDILPTIRVPTLVVAGEASHSGIDSQRWVAGQIPGARLAVIPAGEGGSHFCFLENPDRYNAELRCFLAAS